MTTTTPPDTSVAHDDVVIEPDAEVTQAQRLFPAHAANVQQLRDQYGHKLAAMDVGELLALQALLDEQLDEISDQQLSQTVEVQSASLSPGDVSRIAEEHHRRFYNFQCRLALALEGWFDTLEARGATLAHKGQATIQKPQGFPSSAQRH